MGNETLTEIVDRETVADEAEDGTEDTETQAEPGGEPEPEQEPQDTLPAEPAYDFDKARRKIEAAATKYEKAVRDALGSEAELLEPCPLDQIPGFVFPFDPSSPDAEARMQAVAAYFHGAERPFVEAPDKERCAPCDGWGQVLSGSRNELHRVELCSRCAGNGWMPKPVDATQQGYTPFPGEIVPQPLGVGNGASGPDVWGREPGHPHYGMVPALVGT